MPTPETLQAIAEAEEGPTPEQLDGAPEISNWFLIWRDGDLVRADGDVSGHPTISEPWITTSPVLGYHFDFEKEEGWLRSRSRWYRLGRMRVIDTGHDDPRRACVDAMEAAQFVLARYRAAWRTDDHAEGSLAQIEHEAAPTDPSSSDSPDGAIRGYWL